MRTLFFTLNLLLAGIIIFVSCQKTDAGVTTARPCPDCTDHTRSRFTGIGTETAIQLSEDYKNMNQPRLLIDETHTDANSIWFSAETMKNFLWKIEQEACRRGCGESLKLGLRLYYGRYPTIQGMNDNDDLEALPDNYQQHHTLFIVPTFQDALNPQTHHDFDPWHWGKPGCTPKSMEEWFSTGNPKPFGAEKSLIFSMGETQYFKSANGGLTAGMNHGGLIPPLTDEGTGY
jgi:hypothetical protein